VGAGFLLAPDAVVARRDSDPGADLFFIFNGAQGRTSCGYMLPIFPLLATDRGDRGRLLVRQWRAWERLAPAAAVSRRPDARSGRRLRRDNDIVLSRKDTRTSMREWMVANIPAGRRSSSTDVPQDGTRTAGAQRQAALGALRRHGKLAQGSSGGSTRARARRRLAILRVHGLSRPDQALRQLGYCWVVSSSMQEGARGGTRAGTPARFRPTRRCTARPTSSTTRAVRHGGQGPAHPFQYDLSFDYEPLNFDRPARS